MIEAVMIWNEPNNKSHWDFEVDPDWRRFAEMAIGAADAVREVNSDVVRVLGGPWYVRGQRTNPVSPRLLAEVLRAGVVHCHQRHVLSSSLAAALCRVSGRKVFVSDLGGGGWDVSAWATALNVNRRGIAGISPVAPRA